MPLSQGLVLCAPTPGALRTRFMSCLWASRPVPVAGAGCWGQEGAWVPLGKVLAFTSVLSATCWPRLSRGVQPRGPRLALSRRGARARPPGQAPAASWDSCRAHAARAPCAPGLSPHVPAVRLLGRRALVPPLGQARARSLPEAPLMGLACRALVPVGSCTSSDGVSFLLLSPLRFCRGTTHRPCHGPGAHTAAAPSASAARSCRPLPVPGRRVLPTARPPWPRPRPHRLLPVAVGLRPAGPSTGGSCRWLAQHLCFVSGPFHAA